MPDAVRRRWIAFDSDRDEPGNRDLYMMRADGSELTRLTKGPDEEREPAFSPDGTRLAYVSESLGAAAMIYVYDFRNGELWQLTQSAAEVGKASYFNNAPAWFPDGTRLVFQRGNELLLIDADGGNEETLAVGADWVDTYRHPVVTPDGREVLVGRWHEIVAFDVETGSRRQIAQNSRVLLEAPSVSPDGSQIVFSTVCSVRNLQLVIAPITGERPGCKAPITPNDGSRPINAAWGPGDFIAYQLDPDEGDLKSSIALVKRGAAPCVFDRDGAHEANPAWAPEGFALPSGFSPF